MTGPAMGEDAFFDAFDAVDPTLWYVATHTSSHPWFDTDWSADALSAKAGLSLRLSPKSGENRFQGAAVRRLETTHYGRYDAVIQPSKGAGLITGFFTYTGPYYGSRHDEIDIEFLGKNTRQMHVAVFADGKLTNRFIDLGFDAADRPRLYSFVWHPDRIDWLVEGRLVYSMNAQTTALPDTPGYLFANLWAADPKIENWAGLAERDTHGASNIACVSFTPLADMSRTSPCAWPSRLAEKVN